MGSPWLRSTRPQFAHELLRLNYREYGQLHRFHSFRRQPFQTSRKSTTSNFTCVRFASTSPPSAIADNTIVTRFKNLLFGTTLGLVFWFGYLYISDSRAGIHQWAVVPLIRLIYEDAEESHEAGTQALKSLYAWGLHPRERGDPDKKGDLSVEVR